MTKGKALIEARGILGPTAHVVLDVDKQSLILLIQPTDTPIPVSKGSTWEEALERAETSSYAKIWSEKSISEANKRVAAEESLKERQISTRKQQVLDFLKDLAAQFKARQEQKTESDAEYVKWKQKRAERFR